MFGFGSRNSNNYNYEEQFNSNIQVKYNNLLSKYENSIQKQEYLEKEYKKLKAMVDNLCKSLMSNEYNYNQLGGNSILNSMDIYKLIEFANIDFQKQKVDYMNMIQKLNEQISTQQQIIQTLKEQLTQTMVMSNRDLSEDDLASANIINNTTTNEMNVFETNNFDMDMNIVEDKKNKSNKITIDAFGNIISDEEEKSVEQKKSNLNKKSSDNDVPKANTNNKAKIVERIKDQNSLIGDIITNNKPKISVEQDNSNDNKITTNNVNNKPVNNSSKQEQQATPTLTIENVDAYMSAMTQIMWDIVETIGVTGLSTSNEILEHINSEKEKYTKSLVLNSISSLIKMNVLSSENISTGYRRFKIFKLSNKGETMFKAKFEKDIVESEIDEIVRQHDNAIHGYTIRDAREFMLGVFKCKSANMNRQEISIKLPDGKTYIPDIVAVHPKGYKMYIEVELGNTPQNDFNEKCNKMKEVTNHLYFVTDVEDNIKKKLEQQISLWVLQAGGKEKIAGTTIYLTTMTQLAKGDWLRTFKY